MTASLQAAPANQLVHVQAGEIGGTPQPIVNARDLHTFLENGDMFTHWIKARIEKYGFEENRDFALVWENSQIKKGRGGDRRSKDYHLSLDMAKELSMVENNAKGREARRYFIDMERQALARPAAPGIAQIEPADEDFILLHYNRRALLVYRRGCDFWYRSAHVASLVGMRDGYSLARSLQPHDLIELKHGKHTGSMVSHRAMLAALGRLKADESKALLEWLQLVIPGAFTPPLAALPDPAFVENTEAAEQLRALLVGKRFVLYSLDDAKMQIRELAPNAIITTPERMPNWIADPFGIPAKLLPDVLQAVGRRMAR